MIIKGIKSEEVKFSKRVPPLDAWHEVGQVPGGPSGPLAPGGPIIPGDPRGPGTPGKPLGPTFPRELEPHVI